MKCASYRCLHIADVVDDRKMKMAKKVAVRSFSAIGEGDTEYYGRVEEIYELLFYDANPPNVVVFKCHWFQPKETRRTHEHLGLVEIKQSTHLDVLDVYIIAP